MLHFTPCLIWWSNFYSLSSSLSGVFMCICNIKWEMNPKLRWLKGQCFYYPCLDIQLQHADIGKCLAVFLHLICVTVCIHDCSNTRCLFFHVVQYGGLMLTCSESVHICSQLFLTRVSGRSCSAHLPDCVYMKSQLSLAMSANSIHISFMEADGLSFWSVFKVAPSLATQYTKRSEARNKHKHSHLPPATIAHGLQDRAEQSQIGIANYSSGFISYFFCKIFYHNYI